MIALFASWSFQELTSQYLDLFKSEMSSLINKRLVVYHNRNFESMSEMGELIGVWLCVEKGGGVENERFIKSCRRTVNKEQLSSSTVF